MSSRHLVDPQLLPLLEVAGSMVVADGKLPEARANVAVMTEMGLGVADPSVSVTEHIAPGLEGGPGVRVLVYRPDGLGPDAPAVLQIHGGGFVFGTAELGDPRNRAMAKSVGCAVVSVDYRLAPETPFPGGLEDCYAALVWLHQAAKTLGIDARRIAIRGESAGGGLAASLALLARDRGGPPIRFQLLIYPMLDDRTTVREAHPFTGEFVWDMASNRFAWESWLGQLPGSEQIPSLAAAARVTDLCGLPPTFIATAALDMFVEENLEYARRLLRAGNSVELFMAAGAFHGFEAMAPDADVSRRFISQSDAALIRAFAQ